GAFEVVLERFAHTAGALPLHYTTFNPYASGALVALVFAVLLHALPAWVVVRVLPNGWPRVLATAAFAAALGYAWQATIRDGEGLEARPDYVWIRGGLAFGGLLVPAAFSVLVVTPGFVPRAVRTAAMTAAVWVGFAFNQSTLRSYREFHGYLTFVVILGLAWLLAPVARLAVARWVAAACIVSVGLAANVAWPEVVPVEANVRRLSPYAGHVLAALPLTAEPTFLVEPIVDPDRVLRADELERAEAWRRAKALPAHGRRGKNVLIVVLESTRADTWADPAVTKTFQSWKRNGLYVPKAVAQYPATPLAYGSMFTSLPPSVIIRHPFWARHSAMAALRNEFDTWILSQPNNYWFRSSAISRFIAPKEFDAVHAHRSTPDALSYLWKRVRGVEKGKSFFAWVHLYDPHAPYTRHKGLDFGDAPSDAYRSEVAFVDGQLGRFFRWFYGTPMAKDTLVIVLGDHGEGLGDMIDGSPFWGHHVHVHGVLSHVPFFASGPGIPTDVTRGELHVEQRDVLPTLFDFVGRSPPTTSFVGGRSLYREIDRPLARPLVTEAISIRGARFFQLVELAQRPDADFTAIRNLLSTLNDSPRYAPKLALEYHGWKIVRDLMLRRSSLYDLERDPDELHDLARERPDKVRELEWELDEWRIRQTWTLQAGERAH
ncbi:MAG: sulfatase-like hydrolase/transferase, partial [Myxococcales bacterium]|nr:sulfatase-like hydrolase/transferase [Myxococcales bacterium]